MCGSPLPYFCTYSLSSWPLVRFNPLHSPSDPQSHFATYVKGAYSCVLFVYESVLPPQFCHLKPQFGGHPYCSKTCAAQAATYCNVRPFHITLSTLSNTCTMIQNCHLKPKFANFEYCGKNCAAQATANKPQPTVAAGGLGGPYQLVPTLAQMASKGAAAMKGLAAAGPALVATTVPKNVTPAPAVGPAAQPQVAYASPPVVAPPNVQTQAGPRLKSNPFAALPNGNATYTATVTTSNSTTNVLSAPAGVCLIPGCGQPVHIDANGAQQSEYCSLTHREYAYALLLFVPQTNFLLRSPGRR
jgi:hypothetical protein